MNVLNVLQEQWATCFSVLQRCISPLSCRLSESQAPRRGIPWMPEASAGKYFGRFQGKQKAKLNENLRSNRLQLRDPQIGLTEPGLGSKSVEPGIWNPRNRESEQKHWKMILADGPSQSPILSLSVTVMNGQAGQFKGLWEVRYLQVVNILWAEAMGFFPTIIPTASGTENVILKRLTIMEQLPFTNFNSSLFGVLITITLWHFEAWTWSFKFNNSILNYMTLEVASYRLHLACYWMFFF